MRRRIVLLLPLIAVACSRDSVGNNPPSQKPPPPVAGVADPGRTTPTSEKTSGATAAPTAAAAHPDGEQLFQQNCATCHMANGSGVPYLQPAIKGSAWISNEDPQLLLSLILRGSAVLGEAAKAYENDMPPFEHLSDTEIAALATRVRERFAKPPIAKPVTPAEVATARSRPGLP